MNRSERLHYEAAEISDRWIDWYRTRTDLHNIPDLMHFVWNHWRGELDEDSLEGGIPDLFMQDMKVMVLAYSGIWHPSDIVTGHPDDIVWDVAYGMICNYLHEDD